MITILLALGVIAPPAEPSNVTTPTDRTITLTRQGDHFRAAQAIDPTDVMDYVLNLAPLLAAGEAFSLVSFIVVAGSGALGFTILETAPHAPEEIDNSHVRIWVTIDVDSRGLPAWAGPGTDCAIEITGTTDSIPPRTFQRTALIPVAQK